MDNAAYEARFTLMQRDFVVRPQKNAIDWVLSGNTLRLNPGKTGTNAPPACGKNPARELAPQAKYL